MTTATLTPLPFVRRLARRRRRGIALFEVILALGVVGAIIAGAVLLIQSAQDRLRLNETHALINQIRSATQRMYAGQQDYGTLEASYMYTRGELPDNAATGCTAPPATTGCSWVNPFGGTLIIDGFTARRYLIAIDDLDNDACQDVLGPYVGKTRSGSGLVSVAVATNNVAPTQTTSSANPAAVASGAAASAVPGEGRSIFGSGSNALPMVAADLKAMCDEGQGKNQVIFQFGG